MNRAALAFAAAVLAAGCGGDGEGSAPGAPPSVTASGASAAASAAPSASAFAAPSSAASAAPAASAPAALPGRTDGCPDGMVRVEGQYCPDVEQTCVEHHEEFDKDRKRKAGDDGAKKPSTVSERCLRYADPSVCKSKERQQKLFCVDRYEHPNRAGELPTLLVSWTDAKKACEAQGKRLCTEAEFNFACEGEAMLPYTYGFVRDPSKCSIDKEYRKRRKKLYPYERCQRTPACKEHLAELDQRLPAGSMKDCVSPFGVFDMNGNINEWVELPGKKYPDRSGLKGGWWGPVRNRCRPTVGFHKEDDYGYEAGFRCCKDAAPG